MDTTLHCELCDSKPYDTTDKANGEISLVCFDCKNEILTERNQFESWSEEDEELVEEGIEEALRNDTPIETGVK